MKILLVNPPQTFLPKSTFPSGGLPLGLMYIGAVLDKEGFKVKILNAFVGDYPPQKYGDIRHIGMSWQQLREEIEKEQPDIVGIGNPFSTQIDNAVVVARIAKEVNPGILTVMGGPHVSVRPVEFLAEAEHVDLAVVGEGEYTMLDIARHCSTDKKWDGIQGIVHRKEGKVVLNPMRVPIMNLDELPIPAYHLVDMEQYLNPKGIRHRSSKFTREVGMITSRGCPFNCVFCSIHLHMGQKWRPHSKEYVISHVEHLVNKYNVKHIHFEDDNITLNAVRFAGILDDLLTRDIKITWDTPNGIRADGLTLDILRKVKQSGCTDLTIGVESGSQHTLDTIIDKHLRLEDVIQMAQMCRQTGIKLGAFFVIGFPGERKEDMKQTTEFALMLRKKYGVQMNLMVATPLWGTRLYEVCKNKRHLTQEITPDALAQATQAWGKGLIRTEDFTPEEVGEIASRAISRDRWLSLSDYLKHPITTLKLARTYPRPALRFIKGMLKL